MFITDNLPRGHATGAVVLLDTSQPASQVVCPILDCSSVLQGGGGLGVAGQNGSVVYDAPTSACGSCYNKGVCYEGRCICDLLYAGGSTKGGRGGGGHVLQPGCLLPGKRHL